MILSMIPCLLVFIISYVKCANLDLTIQGIEPNAGPLYGKFLILNLTYFFKVVPELQCVSKHYCRALKTFTHTLK